MVKAKFKGISALFLYRNTTFMMYSLRPIIGLMKATGAIQDYGAEKAKRKTSYRWANENPHYRYV